MYRIRFHGRGGQGVKTASRILGSALFRAGYQVQDAPRYGAERRGAPIFAYVRADRAPIHERGVIAAPHLVVVVDDTLPALPAAGVLDGVGAATVLLIGSAQEGAQWREALGLAGPVIRLALPESGAGRAPSPLSAAAGAGAAARLLGVVPLKALREAVREELAGLNRAAVAASWEAVRGAFQAMAPHAGIVQPPEGGAAMGRAAPEWVVLPPEPVAMAAPTVYAAGNSLLSRTGLWSTLRPEIDLTRCHGCVWVCGTYCPDNAILVDGENQPYIDYEHCKGCLICVEQCPSHAITAGWGRAAEAPREAADGA